VENRLENLTYDPKSESACSDDCDVHADESAVRISIFLFCLVVHLWRN
jgi:hypothetical protein